MPSEIERGDATAEFDQCVLPAVRIHDFPRFGWRGMLLDCCRHFMTVEFIKRYIDLLAFHKFNRFHWHLTEDQGWRLEVDKYPRLTEIGAWRTQPDGTRYGGYYTKTEVRQVVEYAHERHVTVVPEIEMPFHTGAAIVAYPELGINTGHLAELPPEQRWGKTKGLIAPRPETVAYLQDVLTEVIKLFPSKDIHIGGDEANIRHWASDGEMQAQMNRLKLKDAHELHSWFIKQMDTFLTENRRRKATLTTQPRGRTTFKEFRFDTPGESC